MHEKVIINYIFVIISLIVSEKIEVKLKEGIIKGTRHSTVFDGRLYYAFYRVPYAKPPIKTLRFQDPEVVQKWKGILDATVEFNGACAQPHIVHKHALYGVEDCLYMNIFTNQIINKRNELKSVIVWFHGYAFASSFSHMFGPDFLIDNDVVFISVTYRIGVFGYLKTNDDFAKGNMGLKDIELSLKWIRRNAKRFGGDPNNITVMGADSAGTSLLLLLANTRKRYFSKMILHSSSVFSPSIFQGDPNIEFERLKIGLKEKGISDIRYASTKDLIVAASKIYNSKEMMNFQRQVVPFTPTIKSRNNSLLRMHQDFKEQKLFANLTLLIGFNSQESISEIIPFLQNARLLKVFERNFKYMVPFFDGCSYNYSSKTYFDIAEEIKKYYFKGEINEMSIKEFISYTTDLHIFPIYKFINELLKTDTLFYAYKFNYKDKFNAVKITSTVDLSFKVNGAAKGDELCYLLRCEPLQSAYINLNEKSANNSVRDFIKDIAKMWTNFAKYGDPTPGSQRNRVTWSPITKTNNIFLLIDKVFKMIKPHRVERMYQFWNTIYDRFYHKKHCEYLEHEEL